MIIKYKVLPGGHDPEQMTDGAAGFDLYAREGARIWHGEPKLIPTGICLEMPSSVFAQVVSRSGLMSRGLMASTGIIDSDYRGEIFVCLNNMTVRGPWWVSEGERIAQLVFLPVAHEAAVGLIERVDELTPTDRGSDGFGSTGK